MSVNPNNPYLVQNQASPALPAGGGAQGFNDAANSFFSTHGVDFSFSEFIANLLIGFFAWLNPEAVSKFGKEIPPLEHGMTAEILESKAARVLSPKDAGYGFVESVNNKAEFFNVMNAQGAMETYSLVERVDNKENGFSGAIYRNETTGHAVVFYEGMTARSDKAGVALDTKNYWLAEQGYVDNQMPDAQRLYTKAAQMSDSVEIVAHSMGTMHANTMAALYKAKVTNMSDIGLPKLYATAEGIENVRNNVTSLRIEGDGPPELPSLAKTILQGMGHAVGGYGDGRLYAGKIHGQEIVMARPGHEQIMQAAHKHTPQDVAFYAKDKGLEHSTLAYALAMEGVREAAPQVEPANNFYNHIAPGQQI